VEVINLGAPGLQSEDVLQVLKKFHPVLKPDLVVYGICLNDFLESMQGQEFPWSIAFSEDVRAECQDCGGPSERVEPRRDDRSGCYLHFGARLPMICRDMSHASRATSKR